MVENQYRRVAKLAGADNLEITKESAQAIVNDIGGIVKQKINMMNQEGVIIASTDKSRIGHIHEGARRVLDQRLSELYITPECATNTTRVGLNLPIVHDSEFVGVIGITGDYEQVKSYGQIVKKMVEILIRENWVQDEIRLKTRVVSRFLEDWVLGDGLLHQEALAERGFKLGINIAPSRRVMVVSVRNLDDFIATSEGQKLLERVEKDVAAVLDGNYGSMILRNTGRQIILLNKCSDAQMTELADRLSQMVKDKYKVTLAVGMDGSGEDIHSAYAQANQAWRSAKLSSSNIRSYDQVTLELFAGDISKTVKMEYIRKVFRGCGYEEICQWMEVLEAYFAAEGSIHMASQVLYIHKNTLTYKLKKLWDITGYDVRMISNTAVFYMALLFFKDVKQELDRGSM